MSTVERLARIQLICSNAERTARFYEAAFGFGREDRVTVNTAAFGRLIGIPDASARIVVLRLGDQAIELAEIAPRGRDYPGDVSGDSPLFQHFAIVVDDMPAAYARLSAQGGWTAISTDGPERLPASSGGVTAFKFRDPEGHPLELLGFASGSTPVRWRRRSPNRFLGIDHSALSVADTARSIAFYQGLGLTVTGGSTNVGREQDRLDGICGAHAEVTTLAPPTAPSPHVELLCYRRHFDCRLAPAAPNDVASTRLVLAVDRLQTLEALCDQNPEALLAAPEDFGNDVWRAMLRDPDRHRILLEVAP